MYRTRTSLDKLQIYTAHLTILWDLCGCAHANCRISVDSRRLSRHRVPLQARYIAILINRRYTVIFRVIRQHETNIKAYGSRRVPSIYKPRYGRSNPTLISCTQIITFRGFQLTIKIPDHVDPY